MRKQSEIFYHLSSAGYIQHAVEFSSILASAAEFSNPMLETFYDSGCVRTKIRNDDESPTRRSAAD
jgi:hypothetical protein